MSRINLLLDFGSRIFKRRSYQIFAIAFILITNITPSPAQDNKEKNIVIDKDAVSQTLTFEGTSGGKLAAVEITKTENTATGYCDGFVNRQPNHLLKLDSFFDFLKVEIESSADTTILIKGPGGIWCNDDSENANPAIEGEWQPGVYQVWIGSYQKDSSNNYRIQITGN